MNIVIFDTETTSLEKPFCYNIGYTIKNIEERKTLLRREFVVEQVWHNLPLFESAYYKDKRAIYISRMKAKAIKLEKYGYITQQMIRDFKQFEIEFAYAYNSGFDDKVFNYNCEWFKVVNPFEQVKILDIRGLVHEFIAFTTEFKEFCEQYERFTESGNYSTTAETLYQFISGETSFIEEHTALADSEIESEILFECLDKGGQVGIDYKVYKTIPREITQTLEIIDTDKQVHSFEYTKKTTRGNRIYLK